MLQIPCRTTRKKKKGRVPARTLCKENHHHRVCAEGCEREMAHNSSCLWENQPRLSPARGHSKAIPGALHPPLFYFIPHIASKRLQRSQKKYFVSFFAIACTCDVSLAHVLLHICENRKAGHLYCRPSVICNLSFPAKLVLYSKLAS